MKIQRKYIIYDSAIKESQLLSLNRFDFCLLHKISVILSTKCAYLYSFRSSTSMPSSVSLSLILCLTYYIQVLSKISLIIRIGTCSSNGLRLKLLSLLKSMIGWMVSHPLCLRFRPFLGLACTL